MSEEALQIAEERREVKGKGEKERWNPGLLLISVSIIEV